MGDVALRMSGIRKAFGNVTILNDVALEVNRGEVRALLGENGAGKSSLMKILMGVYRPDAGEYVVGGKPVRFAGPSDAQRNGVSMVYQEFGLIQYLSVTENILLGRLPTRLGRIDWPAARRRAVEILARLGSTVDPDAMVGDLKVADQQEVEIARALSYDPLVFIMDEPSSALSRTEIDNLYRLVNTLRSQGVAIIYITHKLEEVFALADRVTVLRDGSVVGTYAIGELTIPLLVERMTGKKVAEDITAADRAAADTPPVLEVRNLSAEGLFADVSLTVNQATIVGIAGVIGAGKSELARAILGALPEGTRVSGDITFDGRPLSVAAMNPARARALGIGFVSEDRQAEGIVQGQTVLFNTVLPALRRVSSALVMSWGRARALTLEIIDTMGLRPRAPTKLVDLLSGGNQQKVVIGKWIAAQSRFLILDEPTRGIDVGARQEIYDAMRAQARDKGLGILLLSSDFREVLVASDRIFVMTQGRLSAEVPRAAANERTLLELALPLGDASAPAAEPA